MSTQLLPERQDWYTVSFHIGGERLTATRVWAPSASNALAQGQSLRPMVTSAYNSLVKSRKDVVQEGEVEVRAVGQTYKGKPITRRKE